MSVADRYATFANFGGGNQLLSSRPLIKSVVISECIKRRLPSKHYVYKMEVEWSNGTSSIVYRRYSMFFDFQVKLQELYSSVCHKDPQFVEKVPHLPELPGKILFGRSQIHQVAEKRRVKIEEFCQQLVSLPAEISHTNLVMGFFNTWPDDTMLPMHSSSASSSVSTPSQQLSPFSSSSTLGTFPVSPTSPSASTPASQVFSSSSASEAVISHPDEMENLEQYRVLADYQRKDSHQVNLTAGQVVHVIEKHDTGWWMVMSEDEQGYAPAAYLEPMEEKNQDQLVDSTSSEEYEAMESYSAQNEDEVDFYTGDKVEVINKSMDGWWKIRCNGKVGVAPSALIRKRVDIPQEPSTDVIYESHKSIYEGLNIHKPPPRRNTIERNHKVPSPYDVPRPLLGKKPADLAVEESDYADPPLELTSEDEEVLGYYQVPKPLQITDNARNRPKVSGSPPKSSEGPSLQKQSSSSSVGGRVGQWKWNTGSLPAGSSGPTSPRRKDSAQSISSAPPSSSQAMLLQTLEEDIDNIYSTVPEESPYELESSSSVRAESSSPLYQNMDEAKSESDAFKGSEPGSPTSPSAGHPSPLPPTPSSPPNHTTNKEKDSDYVDIDDHDEYVNPEELLQGEGETSNPLSPTLYKPLPKPPLPTSDPPKKKPKMAHSVSLSSDIIMEDEYVPMEPIYTEPPPEDSEKDTSSTSQQEQQKQPPTADQQEQPRQPKQQPPLSQSKQKKPQAHPQPYSKHKALRDRVQISSPVLVSSPAMADKKCLTRAKSLEDLLASSSSRESSPQRLGSPPGERKFGQGGRTGSPARVPILPPFPVGRGGGSDHVDGKGLMSKKPKPGKLKAGKGRKAPSLDLPSIPGKSSQQSEGPQHLSQPTSPPRGASPEHRTVTHTTSTPLLPPARPLITAQGKSLHLKTYVAVSDYHSQIDGCLSFLAGDKCVLLRKTQDGWWLVNIGGREGWTPEGFWKEETWNQNNTIARPPGPPPTIAPQQLLERKPRSHTVAGDSFGTPTPDLPSSLEGSLEVSRSSLANSVEAERQPSGEREMAAEARKITPPPPPPQSSKPGKRVPPPPPKPKPFPASNAPWRRGGDKPALPQKPTNVPPTTAKHPPARRSPSNPSPPLPRRQSEEQTPSPPPLAPRRVEQSEKPCNDADEYVMLEDARTKDISLESCPWFVGKMERVQAEQFLMEHGRQREFLVRERTAKDGYYALSLRYHYSCKHFNIDPTPDGKFAIGTLTFPAIADIVHHYQNNSLFIHEGQHVTLSSPARRRTRGADMRPHS